LLRAPVNNTLILQSRLCRRRSPTTFNDLEKDQAR
jgi:hypothetical protein